MDFIKVFPCFLAIILGIAMVVFFVKNAGLFGSVAKGGKIRRSHIREYAKRYLRKFPNSSRKGLREALRQEFVPERVSGRDTDREMLGCLLFGMLGWVMASMSQAAAANMGDAEIRRIKDTIEDVIEDLYDDEEDDE